MDNWVVDVDESCPPEFRDDPAFISWFESLKTSHGTPPIVGWSPLGRPETDGPRDTLVEFVVVPKPLRFGDGPPYAIIGIRGIRPRPQSAQ